MKYLIFIGVFFVQIFNGQSSMGAGLDETVSTEPDHLIPLDPYDEKIIYEYNNRLRKLLKLDQRYYIGMLVKPSRDKEYSIVLTNSENHEHLKLTYAKVQKKIWGLGVDENVNIKVVTASFPKILGKRIVKAWRQVLMQTRYPKVDHRGLDGISYEFSSSEPHLYGLAWSPKKRQRPLLLIQLGESLINFSKSNKDNRAKMLLEIKTKVQELENYQLKRGVSNCLE